MHAPQCAKMLAEMSLSQYLPSCPEHHYHDNVCMLCEEWTENTRAELRKGTSVKYNITSEPDLAFYNESNAQAEYTLSCLPNIDEKLSTTTIGIIAGGAFLALLAAVAIFRQQRKEAPYSKGEEHGNCRTR